MRPTRDPRDPERRGADRRRRGSGGADRRPAAPDSRGPTGRGARAPAGCSAASPAACARVAGGPGAGCWCSSPLVALVVGGVWLVFFSSVTSVHDVEVTGRLGAERGRGARPGGRAARRVAGHQRPRRRHGPGRGPGPGRLRRGLPRLARHRPRRRSPSARRSPSWSGRARGVASTTTACCSAATTSDPQDLPLLDVRRRDARRRRWPRPPPSWATCRPSCSRGCRPCRSARSTPSACVLARRHPDQLGERRRVGRQGRGAHPAHASRRPASTTSPPPAAPPSPSSPCRETPLGTREAALGTRETALGTRETPRRARPPARVPSRARTRATSRACGARRASVRREDFVDYLSTRLRVCAGSRGR